MKKLYRSLTKLPSQTREVITLKANGKRVIESKIVTNLWLLVLENGNSVALTEEQLKSLGISVEKEETKQKVVDNSDKVTETVNNVNENVNIDDKTQQTNV